MHVGFTGTRNGMTDAQKDAFANLLVNLNGPDFCRDAEFHHGDCIGADDQAATIAHEGGLFSVVCHPPADESHRAFNPYATFTLEPKTHFARNRDIVNETDVLIVCPLQAERQTRGGTWYTYDYAIKRKKKVTVIFPDGTTENNW